MASHCSVEMGIQKSDEYVVLFVQELGELMQWLADLGRVYI